MALARGEASHCATYPLRYAWLLWGVRSFQWNSCRTVWRLRPAPTCARRDAGAPRKCLFILGGAQGELDRLVRNWGAGTRPGTAGVPPASLADQRPGSGAALHPRWCPWRARATAVDRPPTCGVPPAARPLWPFPGCCPARTCGSLSPPPGGGIQGSWKARPVSCRRLSYPA